MGVRFAKLHGLGNDFVVVDRRDAGAPVPPDVAVAMCLRHRGIGADGVLSILRSSTAPLAMHVTNADGSLAEMCGNGLRCVVRWAIDRGLLPPEGGAIETGRGVLASSVLPGGDIRVDMGAPSPLDLGDGHFVERPLDVGDGPVRVTAVSMGNPHAVIFPSEGELEPLARELGPAIERHPLFPHRTNVEFARFRGPREIDLVVWERGSGLTLACGTGACATAYAAILTGRAQAGDEVVVHLPGGPLRVRVEPDLSRVWMSGPALAVYEGTWP